MGYLHEASTFVVWVCCWLLPHLGVNELKEGLGHGEVTYVALDMTESWGRTLAGDTWEMQQGSRGHAKSVGVAERDPGGSAPQETGGAGGGSEAGPLTSYACKDLLYK